MKTSETIEALATALAAAQADMKNATLNKVNPHFKSKYADLAGIRDATAPILAKHGLTITQFTTVDGERLSLTTRLLHKSGQWMEGEYPLPMSLDKPQAMGSALTYARRYCWSAVCGIAAEEDDDGHAAQQNGNGTKANGNGSRRQDGPAEPVLGKLNKTKLTESLRDFNNQLLACTDESELDGLLHSYKDVLEQCKHDLPSWWQTKEGSDALGLADRIDAKRAELSQPNPYREAV